MSTAVVGVDDLAPVVEQRDGDDLLSGPAWSRHPLDLARLVVAAVALVATLALAVRRPSSVRSVSVDLVDVVGDLPTWVSDLLLGTTQLLALLVPVVMLVVLARSSPRLLATAVGAAAVAGGVMALVQHTIDDMVPNQVVRVTEEASFVVGAAFPSAAYIAGFTAGVVVLGPVLSRGWRRTAVVGLALSCLTRVVTAVAVPLNLAITVSLGALVGSAALAALGSPRRRASRRAVLAGLASAGFAAERIEPVAAEAAHARTFIATTASGRRAFVKLLGRDERSADVLFRALRALRVKDLDDERPGWSPADLVEHEAFTGLLAARRGVSVADVVAVGTTAGGDGVLALAVVDGTPLDQLPADEVTDLLLDAVWAQVRDLRRQGLAHRWLTASHLLVAPGGAADAEGADGDDPVPALTLVDFRWSVRQAQPEQLAADVAMLAVSLSLLVGASRAVAAAARVLDPAELAAALPLVQPLALPSDLRKQVDGNQALLPLVRKQMQAAAGGVTYQLADIERISAKQLVTLFGSVVATYTLLSFASNWADISTALRSVAPQDLPALVLLAAVPYVAGAATFASVVPRPLPFGEVVRLMVGQSFLNRFTPANAGGMALRVRYLQKRGVDLGGAAAGVALTAAASAIGQVAVLATFAAWAGSDGGFAFSLPRASSVAVALAVLAAVGSLVWFTPLGRRVIGRRLATTARQVWTTLRDLARRPARFVTLFATTIASKVAVIIAFCLSCRALDVGLGIPKLGLLYLTASSLAAAAPTPGGVGAVEAALTAALTGVGVPPADALSAVFLFRLFSYWLPVPFGWFSLQKLRRTALA